MSNPAGWYPDPSNAPQTRYWDGNEWSGDVRPFDPPEARQAAPGKRRGNGWITTGAVIAIVGIFFGFMASATTHVDAYGNATQGGPTVGTFLVIGLGVVLVVIGFCIRLLRVVEKH